MPTRIDGDLFAAAKSAGAVASRSAAQQISHWARIGRELEAAPGVSHADIERVLSGHGAYDALREREQAVVRATRAEGVALRIEGLDYAERFEAAGEDWSSADETGAVEVHQPSQSKRRTRGRSA